MIMRYKEGQSSGPFGKLVTFVLGALTLVAALTFSLFLLAAVLVIGAGAWIYVWWKKRELKRESSRQTQEQGRGTAFERSTAEARDQGVIIEGEATRGPDENGHSSP